MKTLKPDKNNKAQLYNLYKEPTSKQDTDTLTAKAHEDVYPALSGQGRAAASALTRGAVDLGCGTVPGTVPGKEEHCIMIKGWNNPKYECTE